LDGGTISVLLDALESAPIARCAVPNTGGWQKWANMTCTVPLGSAFGVHDVAFRMNGRGAGSIVNVRWWIFTGGAASGDKPPPVNVLVALHAASTGHYVQVAAEPESDGLLTAGGNRSTPLDASLLFLLHDLEDGTYALQAAQGSPRAGLFVCATLNGQGPLRAHSAAGTETCARFWHNRWLLRSPFCRKRSVCRRQRREFAAPADGDRPEDSSRRRGALPVGGTAIS
jgi:hypothetical protein